MDDTISTVKKQYTLWPFPKPIEDIEEWKTQGGYSFFDPLLDHVFLWPDRGLTPDLSILIAGCGTMEAAIEAYNNPGAKITGIDLSPASLEHAKNLKRRHKLENLELLEMDLCDAPKLGRKFDLIVSFGVLHHLKEPCKGLAALAEVLDDSGAMFLSVYGKHQRDGVYKVQEALRRMKVSQSKRDVEFTCELMSALPPWHPALSFVRDVSKPDVAAIVDTFLHVQDCAFSVPEILELPETCGLAFQGWFDNLFYYPEGTIEREHPIYERLMSLPEAEQWTIVELLTSPLFEHAFTLRKNGHAKTFPINFEDDAFFKMIPSKRRTLRVEEEKPGLLRLSRERTSLELRGFERKLFLSVDGMKSADQIVSENAFGVLNSKEKARIFFRLMWKLGHFAMGWIPCAHQAP